MTDILPIPEPVPKKNKIVNWLIGTALVIVALCLAILLGWAFQDADVLVVKNEPFPVRTVSAEKAGTVVILQTEYCKDKDIDGIAQMSFVSKSRKVLVPMQAERSTTGCYKREIPIIIPSDLPPDTYKVHFDISYNVNPLKKNQIVSFDSQPFLIQ